MKATYRFVTKMLSTTSHCGPRLEITRKSGVRYKTTSKPHVSLDEVCVRIATMRDKTAILNIDTENDIYFGQDCIPYHFERYMNCRNTTCLVAEIDKAVVGFMAETLVDNGQTVILRNIRTKPTYRYIGIPRVFFLSSIRRNVGCVLAGVHPNPASMGTGLVFQSSRQVLTRQIHGFEFELKDNHFSAEKNKKALTEVNEPEFRSILSSRRLTQHLFPHNRIVISWMPFKPTLSNIPLLFWHDEVMYSDLGDTKRICACDKVNGLLTSSSFFPVCNSNWICNIDVFGTDITSLESHILTHIAILKERAHNCKVILYICSEEGLPIREYIRQMFRKNGVALLNPTTQTSLMRRQYVLEFDVTVLAENLPKYIQQK